MNDYKKLVGSFHDPVGADGILDPFDRDVFGDDVKGGDCDTNDDGGDTNGIEESFDARYNWFQCPSISHIWNQGNCAADWVRYIYVYRITFIYCISITSFSQLFGISPQYCCIDNRL